MSIPINSGESRADAAQLSLQAALTVIILYLVGVRTETTGSSVYCNITITDGRSLKPVVVCVASLYG